jgi:RNA polymerase sigma factor (sigma-70 family)
MNGSELLTGYRETGSDVAFANLLRRYSNLVYSVAKRRLSNQSLAEEVTQTVFTRLANARPKIKSDGELVAWLHRTTVHVSIDVWRSETRRRTREQEAVLMQPGPADDARLWEEMTPHLDEALNQLSDDERQVVLLRFFERKPMREIGGILGVSEDAAKMRVSRAINRLRDQFALRGVACTVVILAMILPQRAVEAAPNSLLASLMAIRVVAPAAAGGIPSAILRMLRSKVILGTTALFVAAIVGLVLKDRSRPREVESASAPAVPSPQPEDNRPGSSLSPRAARGASSAPAVQPATRFILHVIDQGAGTGLPGAKVQAAYFYAGGVGEGHSLETDADGNAPIPEPDHAEKHVGLNFFVSLEGYVPKAVNLHGTDAREDYVLPLEPAVAVGGTVVDEQGWPVAGVELQASRSEFDPMINGMPSTDFQTSKIKTDAEGRWYFPYVPKTYTAIDFYLTASNYALTYLRVPVGQPGSSNATLVIDRGFAVEGRVTDAEGRPVIGATVKELHNYASRKLSAKTDANGYFALSGVGVPVWKTVNLDEPTKPVVSFAKQDMRMDIVVELKGMASQRQTVQLIEPTNRVDFVLAAATVFRGRVVDEAGNPIPGAVVRTDFDFKNQIDAEGRFEWDSAPAEPVCFWFEADDYEIIRGMPIPNDGSDHEIRLTPKRIGTANR